MEKPYRIGSWDGLAGRDDFACGKPKLDAYWRAMAGQPTRMLLTIADARANPTEE